MSGSETLDRAADVARPTAELLTALRAGDLVELGKSAKKLYDVAEEFEQLHLPKNPLDLARGVLRRVTA